MQLFWAIILNGEYGGPGGLNGLSVLTMFAKGTETCRVYQRKWLCSGPYAREHCPGDRFGLQTKGVVAKPQAACRSRFSVLPKKQQRAVARRQPPSLREGRNPAHGATRTAAPTACYAVLPSGRRKRPPLVYLCRWSKRHQVSSTSTEWVLMPRFSKVTMILRAVIGIR